MASFVANIAKGRVVEYYNRVENNDPSASALIVVVITQGAATDDSMKDADTLTALLAISGVVERNTNNWARKTLTDVELANLPAPDDTNNRYDVSLPAMTWSAVASGGGASTHLVVCYDADTGAGTDANITPLTFNDFAITPDGSDVTANSGVFFRATD